MREPLSVEEVQALGEHIAEQAVHLDAAMHRLLADLRTFDAAGGWYRQGFGTCAHWLSWRVGWDLGTAREHLRVARALHTLPQVSAALAAGQISYSKTRAITRVATAATEAVLLGYAQHCTASQLETVCRKVGVLGADAASRATRPHDSERYVAHTTTASGMVCVKACLRPDEAALARCCKPGAARASRRSWNVGASANPDAGARLPRRLLTFPRKRQHLPSERRAPRVADVPRQTAERGRPRAHDHHHAPPVQPRRWPDGPGPRLRTGPQRRARSRRADRHRARGGLLQPRTQAPRLAAATQPPGTCDSATANIPGQPP
ncbi:MAG: DUF222 domain-containing protein [Myxococcales bacterium]|nr:DUF222 domain-containing protein [Myxococcales bacterium]